MIGDKQVQSDRGCVRTTARPPRVKRRVSHRPPPHAQPVSNKGPRPLKLCFSLAQFLCARCFCRNLDLRQQGSPWLTWWWWSGGLPVVKHAPFELQRQESSPVASSVCTHTAAGRWGQSAFLSVTSDTPCCKSISKSGTLSSRTYPLKLESAAVLCGAIESL